MAKRRDTNVINGFASKYPGNESRIKQFLKSKFSRESINKCSAQRVHYMIAQELGLLK